MNEPKITPLQVTHELYITWPHNQFAGYDTKLTIVKYAEWAEISLSGGARDEDNNPINKVPIDVLRKIVEMHDNLP